MTALGQTAGELRRAVDEARAGWTRVAWITVAAVALAPLMPFLSLPGVRLDSLADTVYLAVAATGLGLTVGAAGLPSLGAGAFMAIGAFTSALLVPLPLEIRRRRLPPITSACCRSAVPSSTPS